jgi:hypothetical protein
MIKLSFTIISDKHKESTSVMGNQPPAILPKSSTNLATELPSFIASRFDSTDSKSNPTAVFPTPAMTESYPQTPAELSTSGSSPDEAAMDEATQRAIHGARAEYFERRSHRLSRLDVACEMGGMALILGGAASLAASYMGCLVICEYPGDIDHLTPPKVFIETTDDTAVVNPSDVASLGAQPSREERLTTQQSNAAKAVAAGFGGVVVAAPLAGQLSRRSHKKAMAQADAAR